VNGVKARGKVVLDVQGLRMRSALLPDVAERREQLLQRIG
jgi:hypothetical protein